MGSVHLRLGRRSEVKKTPLHLTWSFYFSWQEPFTRLPRSMPNVDQCQSKFWHWSETPLNANHCWSVGTGQWSRESCIYDQLQNFDLYWSAFSIDPMSLDFCMHILWFCQMASGGPSDQSSWGIQKPHTFHRCSNMHSICITIILLYLLRDGKQMLLYNQVYPLGSL